jgi:hypothetical protein
MMLNSVIGKRGLEEADMSALPVEHKRRSPAQIVSEWWQEWTGFNPTYSDMFCCAQEEVDRIAHDIGVSASELRKLATLGPNAADQLLARMEEIGVHPDVVERAEPSTFQDMQRTCSLCDSHKRCEQDLANHSTGRAWEHYCANASTLKMLRTMPWPGRRDQ